MFGAAGWLIWFWKSSGQNFIQPACAHGKHDFDSYVGSPARLRHNPCLLIERQHPASTQFPRTHHWPLAPPAGGSFLSIAFWTWRARLFLGDGFKSSTETATDRCRPLIFRHQDAVRTVKGHKLPLFLNNLPANDLSRGTAGIHKEKLPITFRYVSKNRHRQFPS